MRCLSTSDSGIQWEGKKRQSGSTLIAKQRSFPFMRTAKRKQLIDGGAAKLPRGGKSRSRTARRSARAKHTCDAYDVLHRQSRPAATGMGELGKGYRKFRCPSPAKGKSRDGSPVCTGQSSPLVGTLHRGWPRVSFELANSCIYNFCAK
jgi:hypothetical protein